MATIVHEGAMQDRRMFPRRAADRSERPATVVRDTTVVRETGRDTDGMRVSWGGIWGGVLVGMGTLMLLTALGLAIGITAVDPGDTQAQTVGMGAAIWGGLSLLIALYLGGLVSTRIGAIFDKTTGVFEGALVWVLSLLLVTWLASSGISFVAGGVFKMVGGATQTIGSVMTGGQTTDLSQGSVDQIVQRLRDPQTARMLSGVTGIPEAEMQTNLSQMADRADAARDNPAQVATDVRQGVQDMMQRAQAEGRIEQAAERAQGGATTAAWVTFGALVLSLLAAILGAMTGRRSAAHQAGRA